MSNRQAFKRSLTDIPSQSVRKHVSKDQSKPKICDSSPSKTFMTQKTLNSFQSQRHSLSLLKYEFELEEFERKALRTFWESKIIQLSQEAGENPLKYLEELRECITN